VFDLLQRTTREDITIPEIEILIDTALDLQKTTFTSILAAAGVIFSIGILALATLIFHIKSKGSPPAQGTLRRAILFLMWTSAALAFAAAFSLLQVITALNFQRGSTEPNTRISGGTASQAFHWLSFSFNWLFAVGASVVYGSVSGDGKQEGGTEE
jgi:hypothetical protein